MRRRVAGGKQSCHEGPDGDGRAVAARTTEEEPPSQQLTRRSRTRQSPLARGSGTAPAPPRRFCSALADRTWAAPGSSRPRARPTQRGERGDPRSGPLAPPTAEEGGFLHAGLKVSGSLLPCSQLKHRPPAAGPRSSCRCPLPDGGEGRGRTGSALAGSRSSCRRALSRLYCHCR